MTPVGLTSGSIASWSTSAAIGSERSSRWRATDISDQLNLAGSDDIGPAEDREALGDAIATLSPDHQVIVALRYYRDLSIDQIAARLDVPPGTVQSRLHYALKRLNAALDAPEKGVDR